MVTITKNNRISIPSEIMQMKGWEVGTELIFIPLNQEAGTKLTIETPIGLDKVPTDKNKKKM